MEAQSAPIPPWGHLTHTPLPRSGLISTRSPNISNDHTYLHKEIYDLWTIHNSHVSIKPLRRKSSFTVKWCDYTSTPQRIGVIYINSTEDWCDIHLHRRSGKYHILSNGEGCVKHARASPRERGVGTLASPLSVPTR